ncbi:hypothetical protein QLX67_06175 [Balneolaceae bacterium ANBcel3]|nr:hypothetical protein [Balneolaceae bacterium ANBcel3]
MRNITFLLYAFLAAFLFAGLTGCNDDVTTSALTVDMMEEATVTVYLYAELDRTELGLEYAPDGTRVLASVEYSNLNPSASSGSYMDTLEVQGGMIEVTMPVTSSGTTVTFFPQEFVAAQVQPYGSNVEEISKIFRVPGHESSIGNLRPGQSRIHEITYAEVEDFDNYTEKVEMRFEGFANFSAVDPETVNLPSNTDIHLHTDHWTTTVRTNSDGIFTANIPRGESVTVEFVARKIVQEDPTVRQWFKYETTAPAFQSSQPSVQPLHFGEGILWE